MSRINIFNKYPPIMGFYVPTDWFINKNKMFDIDPSEFEKIKSEDELFLIKDHLFYEDVFIANSECYISTKSKLSSFVSIRCVLFDEEPLYDVPVCFYNISFSFKKVGKGQATIYEKETVVTNRFDAVKEASLFMKLFTHYVLPDFSNNLINEKTNFEKYFEDIDDKFT